jgi:hypothetical protein
MRPGAHASFRPSVLRPKVPDMFPVLVEGPDQALVFGFWNAIASRSEVDHFLPIDNADVVAGSLDGAIAFEHMNRLRHSRTSDREHHGEVVLEHIERPLSEALIIG